MKLHLIILALFFFGNIHLVLAQELPVFSEYLHSKYYLSPAAAGIDKCANLIISHRQQWTGIKDAPNTQGIAAFTRLNILQSANSFTGIGALLHNDNNGPNNIKRFQITTAYHTTLWRDRFKQKDLKLSFGLAFSGFQYKLNEAGLIALEAGDPTLLGTSEAVNLLNFDAGMMIYNENYTFAITAAQLNPSDIKIFENETMPRYFFYYFAYKKRNAKGFGYQPSVMLKTSPHVKQFDINTIVFFNDVFSLGGSYRRNLDNGWGTNLAAMLLMGLDFKEYYFQYSYDMALTNIMKYNYGSHEILFGYRICKQQNIPKY